jgi:high affinity Mn2+ porin
VRGRFFVPDAPESKNWNIHAQTTFILQGYPGFRSPARP